MTEQMGKLFELYTQMTTAMANPAPFGESRQKQDAMSLTRLLMSYTFAT